MNARQRQLGELINATRAIQAEHDRALRKAQADRRPHTPEPNANALWAIGGYAARHGRLTDAIAVIVEEGPDGNAALFNRVMAEERKAGGHGQE